MCGAQVKWKNTNIWHSDYNKLPGASAFKYIIEEVNADNAVIMKEGFSYFGCFIRNIIKTITENCDILNFVNGVIWLKLNLKLHVLKINYGLA